MLTALLRPVKRVLHRLGYDVRGARLLVLPPNVRPEQVAEAVLDGPSRIVAVRSIERGHANLGVRIFTAVAQPAAGSCVHPAQPRIRFVGKTTALLSEYDIAAKIMQCWHVEPCYHVFPEIYGVHRHGDTATIYMEHLPGIREVPGFSAETVRTITATVGRINRCFPERQAPVDSGAVITHWQRGIAGALQHAAKGDVDAQASAAVLEAIRADLAALPLIVSHNDLLWHNLTFPRSKDHARIVDFGTLGTNLAGAEFHHFARRAMSSAAYRTLHEQLIAEYAALVEIPGAALARASHAYALFRSAERIGRYRRRLQSEPYRREVQTFLRLCSVLGRGEAGWQPRLRRHAAGA
jgi:hypothetical protein